MNMKLIFNIIFCLLLVAPVFGQKKYEPTWQSLSRHEEAAEWFKDAKFGIYFHWGVYSVPAFGSEWYPRNMHFKQNKEYQHHVKTYGEPSEFGYHDFVPMFKAEQFDAEAWAELFKKAGARFAGPVAEHHDGFSMWDSEITPWNVVDQGPKKDITGELAKALRKRDMKLITTFHHARNLQRYANQSDEKKFSDSHYPLFAGMPPTSEDPELRYLYGNLPEQQWLEEVWLGKLKEVVDQYHPDIIWFDSWLDRIPEEYRQEFCAYYLNQANQWGKEVVIVRKQDDLPLEVSVDDYEKSRKSELDKKVWMTDETISKGSWSYTKDLQIKDAEELLHVLIDIVSKNGVLLLNISPKADGTIPEEQQNVLLQMGEWLEKYGEAIYTTMPWYTYGEGPTKEPEGGFKQHQEFLKIEYSDKDIRYTTKGNTIYALQLGWPSEKKNIVLQSFAKDKLKGNPKIKKISLLGSEEKIDWKWSDQGLVLITPEKKPDNLNIAVYKLEMNGKIRIR